MQDLARGAIAAKAMVVPRLRRAGACVVGGGEPGGHAVSHPFYPSGNPRFNHVAMSVPADRLADPDRADLTPLLRRGARLRRARR